ncbi:anthranilate phosphoribosyltransferase [Salinimicrobium sp. TH3]|uniref:anthranilate phosphoribosyltransferase n=1 Tax=Salinimicrobium sp. TH3 TaxID=2997342 RepID=UPI0022729443|nr:anthranilate phosphoribosyltransferase [Salinimicrobium sp. TH3]MCY2688028.1 anthranilate phosphoribosyltransferase [Salinimicrobium sp. TH3]
MKDILNRLINHETISKEEARKVLVNISTGEYNDSQIAAFLTVYMMRSITLEELEGFRDALLEMCLSTDLSQYDPIDLCGTGGDGKDTFNISTLASFVTAGAGVKVAKHGNYGVSSSCGSSNVMEHFGIKFSNEQNFLKRSMDEAGICFLHAALFHPAMKNVAPIRKNLGVKTFFNMLGPMVNPAFPKKQVVGVYSLELARMYAYLYQKTDKNFTILHALDGYDEISLTGNTKMITNNTEAMLRPADLNLTAVHAIEISGGDSVSSAAEIFMNVLSNKGTAAQENVVCANAAVAINTAKNTGLENAFLEAKESLRSGRALNALKKLQQLN